MTVSQILEERAANRERNGDGTDLRNVNEADGVRNIDRVNLGRGHTVSGLEDQANADSNEYLEAIYGGYVCVCADTEHEGSTNDHQHRCREVPRSIATEDRKQATCEHDEENKKGDEGQQPYGGF